MRIEQAIKEYCKKRHPEDRGFYIPTDELGYWNVNVLFVNSDGNEDETQFDILPGNFDYISRKCKELVLLWEDFCTENQIKQNTVESIYIVCGW